MTFLRRKAALLVSVAISFAAVPAVAVEQSLIDAAKREGLVNWYTVQIVDQLASPIATAFEKKYGVRVNVVRANGPDIAIRILSEAKAGRMSADVFDGPSTVTELKNQGVVMQYVPDSAKVLQSQFVDAGGYWVATNYYVHTPLYNTNLIKSGTQPKTWQDLLDPQWKQKMSWSTVTASSGAPGLIGTVLLTMGQEKGMDYLRLLARQEITPVPFGARQVADQVISGEYPIMLQAFHHHAVVSRATGAPIEWTAISPAMSVLSVASITKDAPHPNAAKLFVDFMISSEGQAIFRDADYIPVDPNTEARDASLKPSPGRLDAVFVSPEDLAKGLPGWSDLFKSIFR